MRSLTVAKTLQVVK